MERSEPRGALRYVLTCHSLFGVCSVCRSLFGPEVLGYQDPRASCTGLPPQISHAGRSELRATQVPRFVLNPEANWGPKHRHKPVQVSHPSITLLEADDVAKACFAYYWPFQMHILHSVWGHLPQPDGQEGAE